MKARLPQGYGGGGGGNMLKQVQKIQNDMVIRQAELDAAVYHMSSGGGMVQVTINGKKEITELTIKPEIVDPDDIEILQDVIMAAVNEAIRTVEETTSTELSKLTGGLNIPGLD